MKLKILASFNFISVIFSEKLFLPNVYENKLSSTGKAAFGAKANKN
jgi:hypothetical protein